tara:strand:+ start:431 stop:727 length:297 start_codon:yes stop_codon:yes gene_type:complete
MSDYNDEKNKKKKFELDKKKSALADALGNAASTAKMLGKNLGNHHKYSKVTSWDMGGGSSGGKEGLDVTVDQKDQTTSVRGDVGDTLSKKERKLLGLE